jgi:hypothetical protein
MTMYLRGSRSVAFGFVGLFWLLFPQMSAAQPSAIPLPCEELLTQPLTSQLLRNQGLPVPSTLIEVERWKAFIQKNPQHSGFKTIIANRHRAQVLVKVSAASPDYAPRVVVHKVFHHDQTQELDDNWEGFTSLFKLRREKQLGDFEIAQIYDVSYSKMTLYLEYIEGIDIFSLVMKPNAKGVGFQQVETVSPGVLKLLLEFDRQIRSVMEAWEKKNQKSERYEIEVSFDTLAGHEILTYLLIQSAESRERLFEISMFNSIYSPSRNQFVIFDPF